MLNYGLVEENNDFTVIHTQSKCKWIHVSKPYTLILMMGSEWAFSSESVKI